MKLGKWRNERMGMKELIDNEVTKWEWSNEIKRMEEWNEKNFLWNDENEIMK